MLDTLLGYFHDLLNISLVTVGVGGAGFVIGVWLGPRVRAIPAAFASYLLALEAKLKKEETKITSIPAELTDEVLDAIATALQKKMSALAAAPAPAAAAAPVLTATAPLAAPAS